jgi:hypothetical protein
LQLSEPRLTRIIDGGVRQGTIRRNDRRVVALDYAGADPGLLPQPERRLEQVRVQPGGGIEPGQGLRRAQSLQPAVTDEPTHDRAVLLLDPGLIILPVGPLAGWGGHK